jgi:uncharacterized protein YjbI with pentapeptide repeats
MRNSADKQELILSQITGNYLQQHNFCGCDLNRIDLSGINLRGANLTGAKLCGATLLETNSPALTEANLAQTKLPYVKLQDTIMPDGTIGQLQIVFNLSC